jgi:hypothetical protein
MFAVRDIVLFAVIAGILAAAVLWAAWRWTRPNRRLPLA